MKPGKLGESQVINFLLLVMVLKQYRTLQVTEIIRKGRFVSWKYS